MKKYLICLLSLLVIVVLATACNDTDPQETQAPTEAQTQAELITTAQTVAETEVETQAQAVVETQIETQAQTVAETEAITTDGSFTTDDYTVTKVGDTYYLNFKNGNEASESDLLHSQVASLSFDSLPQLLERFEKNRFSEAEKSVMRASFKKDDNGIVVFDKNNLYEPVYPNGVSLSNISWSGGDTISWRMSMGGYISVFNKQHLQNCASFNYYYANYPQRITNATITSTYEGTFQGQPCQVIEYTGSPGCEFRVCKVEMELEDKKLYIMAEYQLAYSGSFDVSVSDTVPYMIFVFGEQLDKSFEVYFLDDYYETAPTLEFLTSFGITPYIPPVEDTPVVDVPQVETQAPVVKE